jgi:hypothetical protein
MKHARRSIVVPIAATGTGSASGSDGNAADVIGGPRRREIQTPDVSAAHFAISMNVTARRWVKIDGNKSAGSF